MNNEAESPRWVSNRRHSILDNISLTITLFVQPLGHAEEMPLLYILAYLFIVRIAINNIFILGNTHTNTHSILRGSTYFTCERFSLIMMFV